MRFFCDFNRSGTLRMVRPDAGKAIGLQLDAHRQGVHLLLRDPPAHRIWRLQLHQRLPDPRMQKLTGVVRRQTRALARIRCNYPASSTISSRRDSVRIPGLP